MEVLTTLVFDEAGLDVAGLPGAGAFLLAFDLGVLNRKSHVIGVRESPARLGPFTSPSAWPSGA